MKNNPISLLFFCGAMFLFSLACGGGGDIAGGKGIIEGTGEGLAGTGGGGGIEGTGEFFGDSFTLLEGQAGEGDPIDVLIEADIQEKTESSVKVLGKELSVDLSTPIRNQFDQDISLSDLQVNDHVRINATTLASDESLNISLIKVLEASTTFTLSGPITKIDSTNNYIEIIDIRVNIPETVTMSDQTLTREEFFSVISLGSEFKVTGEWQETSN